MLGATNVASRSGCDAAATALQFQLLTRCSSRKQLYDRRRTYNHEHRELHTSSNARNFVEVRRCTRTHIDTPKIPYYHAVRPRPEKQPCHHQSRSASSTPKNKLFGIKSSPRTLQPSRRSPSTEPHSQAQPRYQAAYIPPPTTNQDDAVDVPIITLKSTKFRLPKPLYDEIDNPSTSYNAIYHKYSPKPLQIPLIDSFLTKVAREVKKSSGQTFDPLRNRTKSTSNAHSNSSKDDPQPPAPIYSIWMALTNRVYARLSRLPRWLRALLNALAWTAVFTLILKYANIFDSPGHKRPPGAEPVEANGEQSMDVGQGQSLDGDASGVNGEDGDGVTDIDVDHDYDRDAKAGHLRSRTEEASAQVEKLVEVLNPLTSDLKPTPTVPVEGTDQHEQEDVGQTQGHLHAHAQAQAEEPGEEQAQNQSGWTSWLRFW